MSLQMLILGSDNLLECALPYFSYGHQVTVAESPSGPNSQTSFFFLIQTLEQFDFTPCGVDLQYIQIFCSQNWASSWSFCCRDEVETSPAPEKPKSRRPKPGWLWRQWWRGWQSVQRWSFTLLFLMWVLRYHLTFQKPGVGAFWVLKAAKWGMFSSY